MANNWTNEQKQAIYEKGSNILVAAAAGSGKTAVLVERIIQKIMKDKIDIDKLLVVTFTNAAASEMRERVLSAIYKKLDENPNDLNLQKQTVLLNKSHISTIHSFCLEVIRNNFYEINVSPNFRIGDTQEIELLKLETIEDLFEELYQKQDKEFLDALNIYTTYRGDEPLKELILQIYRYIQSSPFPEDWIEEKVEYFNIEDTEKDFSQTKWGKVLLQEIEEITKDSILKLEVLKNKLKKEPELEKYLRVIEEDISGLKNVMQNLSSWDNTYNAVNSLEWQRWPVDKKVTIDLKDIVKETRKQVKEEYAKKVNNILLYTSKEANEDILDMYKILCTIKNLVLNFSKKYQENKKEKNIVDFNDIEHYALKILLRKDEEGNYVQTEAAKKYQKEFIEIAVDEYQDSNLVQEYILNAISRGNNIFMVGDVKQSIYKFRQACPELFLNKYETYSLDKEAGENLKIQLFKNFRSRKNVLDLTNQIFQEIMSKKVGDINYTKDEYLNLGEPFAEPEEEINHAGKAELHVINLKEEVDEEEIEQEVQEEPIENTELEAKFVANKIKELIEGNYYVCDKNKTYRKIIYKDIVILLRATSNAAPIYEKALIDLGMPVFSDTSSKYLETIEVNTIISLLKILDNPYNDIPLVTVMRSPIGNFTDNDLIEIRLEDKKNSFYDALLVKQLKEDDLQEKINTFLNNLETWREKANYIPLDELLWQIYVDTGYYHYVSLMPNGSLRQANLKMLFQRAKEYEDASFKGLFNFIRFLDNLKRNSGDLGSAKLIGENANVIRIMSIHKSKGLEFPVVFLSGSGKQFNFKDLNEPVLIHQELGFGPKYINYERRIEYNTLAKEAIKIKTKNEVIAEEMRVLYVALTRAKEKIIITGVQKNYEKSIKEKEELLENELENEKINQVIVKKYKTYLDWIELAAVKNKEKIKEILEIKEHKKEEITAKEDKKETEKKHKPKQSKNEELYNKIDKLLNWKYRHIADTHLEGKTSVGRLKGEENIERTRAIKKPQFLSDTEELTGAEKGTLMHLCMQKLNFKEKYTKETLEEFIQKLVANKIILPNHLKEINRSKLLKFLQSSLVKRAANAKSIYKEQPFYLSLKAEEVYGEKSDESVLVQGIIDLYFIDENGKIVLVDYKTDYVEKVEELEEKYTKQLELYKMAIEKALKRKVDEVYIYSTYLDREIRLFG